MGYFITEEIESKNNLERIFKIFLFVTFSLIVFSAYVTGSFAKAGYWYNINIFSKYFSLPLFFYAFLVCIHLPYRAILWFCYKPYKLKDYFPKISVIIPTYNEGEMVSKALLSCVNSDYPESKLEIICIDDGSTDDTWSHIQKIQQQYPLLITAIKSRRNKGKRNALAIGFRKSMGEILVTMDSDSIADEKAFKAIVAPFVDKKIGAVTAKVKVFNKDENFLTRMLGVRYTMAFEFFRASTSVFKTVMCCSGVLSAYRKSVIMKFLNEWLYQEFMGQVCTYGDDRSLTNFVIRKGFYTVYQRNSVVYTLVPNNLKKLAKMLTRWHKSFIREGIIFSSFMFTRYRKKNRFLPAFDFCLTTILMLFQFYVFFFSLYYITIDPILILRFFSLIVIMGLVYMLFYIRFEKNSDFVYGIIYAFLHVFFLMWTIPYAFITFKNNSWLTR
ncbi:MAG: hypothetical protein A2042_10130 [Candidatus Schekmanbacteria bacterium GWA2_38_11]|uniref:Glycosyltransferase 2-like domain-containing protein n=1 Tax=Candidatus Schekmanbacteria bacterium GWA2_38_11 TaxID=1817876 RepID=A0A1F7RBR5_9BACT|nr:MAG: hypothetical protein A2042_10130 [Candidatus Schekmanbacteria bacterium GWA2_38_11]